MAVKSWMLVDVNRGVYLESLCVGPGDVPGTASGWSVRKRTLRGGMQDGVDVIEVDNGTCRFTLIPTRGMGIWRAWAGDAEIGWKSPVRGPVHPAFVPIAEPSGLGWLDGFDELLVRCGLLSNGAPDFDPQGRLQYPLHGRIANCPAHKVELSVDGDTGEISLTGVVDEARFHFHKLRMTSTVSTRPGEKRLRIHDTVSNFSGEPGEMQILYHVNFGTPLVDSGARLVAPAKTVVPRDVAAARSVATWDSYPAEQAGLKEEVYFVELLADKEGLTRVLLKNAHSMLGVSMQFNTKQLPCFTQWKNTRLRADGYVTGIEPGTNFPNPRTFETQQGRVVKLAPGQEISFEVQIEVHTSADEVAQAESAVRALQGSTAPRVLEKPQKGWSPG
jgi:hypothetical protein